MANDSEFDSLCKRARQSFRAGDYSKASNFFAQALALNPDSAEAQDGAGTVYFMLNQFEKAVEHFSRVSLLKPRGATSYINLGAVYNRMGEHQKAANALRKGIQRDSKSSEGYYNLAIAHRSLNQLPMAVNAYQQAIRLDPQMASAHQNLANVYSEMGNHKKAIEHYENALKIKPNFERARQALERAEQAALDSREQSSPFGRLVDEETLKANRASSVGQELSPYMREQDRTTIDAITSAAIEFAEDLIEHLKEQLEPYLSSLNKTVAEGTEGSTSIFAAHENFRTAVERCVELRTRLKDKLSELQDHERKMNAPGSS